MFVRTFPLLLVLLAAAPLLPAQNVRLVSGTDLDARVKQVHESGVVVDMGGVEFQLAWNLIDASTLVRERKALVRWSDAASCKKYAMWAMDAGLLDEAKEAEEKSIAAGGQASRELPVYLESSQGLIDPVTGEASGPMKALTDMRRERPVRPDPVVGNTNTSDTAGNASERDPKPAENGSGSGNNDNGGSGNEKSGNSDSSSTSDAKLSGLIYYTVDFTSVHGQTKTKFPKDFQKRIEAAGGKLVDKKPSKRDGPYWTLEISEFTTTIIDAESPKFFGIYARVTSKGSLRIRLLDAEGKAVRISTLESGKYACDTKNIKDDDGNIIKGGTNNNGVMVEDSIKRVRNDLLNQLLASLSAHLRPE